MNKYFPYFALILATLLLAAACTSTNKLGGEQSVDSEANKKLSISVISDALGYYENAIKGFKAIHPDVEIELHNYRADYDKYRQQVRTQLMAGEADDLLSFVGFNNPSFFDSGLLTDFYPIMQNDPDFNEADYFTNVFEGFAYQNKLLMFPIFYSYFIISVNDTFSSELTEKFMQYDEITYREVFNLYNSLEDKGNYYISTSVDALTVLERNISAFVDFANNKCYFNTPEFIKFITDAKNGTDPQKIADGYLGYTHSYGALNVLEQPELALKYLFCDDGISIDYYLLPDDAEAKFTHCIPLVHENGTLMIEPANAFLLNEASKNKELAWEFIKYLLTTETKHSMYSFPIHRQIFESYVDGEVFRAIGYMRRTFGEFEPGEAGEQIKARLKTYNEMPMEFSIYLDFDAIKEIMQSFCDGIFTAEQVASELQNKVSLYLME